MGALTLLLVSLGLGATPTAPDSLEAPVVVPPLPDLTPPSAEEEAEAQRAYARSAELFKAADVEGAAAAVERVYELMPNASTALVRSQILETLKRPCAAFTTLAAALDMDPNDAEKREIRVAMQRIGRDCKPGAAWARVRVIPATAMVRVDGRSVPTGRTLVLMAGVHPIEVEAPGHARLRATLKADPGEEVPASFETERLASALDATPVVPETAKPAPVPAAPPPEVVKEAGGGSTTVPWILAAGGAAILGGGVGMHLWALDAASEADDLRTPQPDLAEEERSRRYGDAKDQASSRSTTAYILYGSGAAVLATGVVWLLLSGDEGEGVLFRPAVWLTGSGGGLSLGGSM